MSTFVHDRLTVTQADVLLRLLLHAIIQIDYLITNSFDRLRVTRNKSNESEEYQN